MLILASKIRMNLIYDLLFKRVLRNTTGGFM